MNETMESSLRGSTCSLAFRREEIPKVPSCILDLSENATGKRRASTFFAICMRVSGGWHRSRHCHKKRGKGQSSGLIILSGAETSAVINRTSCSLTSRLEKPLPVIKAGLRVWCSVVKKSCLAVQRPPLTVTAIHSRENEPD